MKIIKVERSKMIDTIHMTREDGHVISVYAKTVMQRNKGDVRKLIEEYEEDCFGTTSQAMVKREKAEADDWEVLFGEGKTYTVKLTRQQMAAMMILTGACAGSHGSYGVYFKLAGMDEVLVDTLYDKSVEFGEWMGVKTIHLPEISKEGEVQ